tara:strand:+ start:5196 stop:6440 length:1245 start_codon:yes stop_codon:yes gene_type:complete
LINLKKKFLIYGYGISGKSVEKFLINKRCNYNIYDDYKKITHKKLINKEYLLNRISEFSYFVVSPSIKIDTNHILYNYKNKILIDLDFLSLEKLLPSIIGITGTEGKSSTCSYLSEILSKKYNTIIIGNFGKTILEKKNLTNYLSKIDYLIIELSSYQLDKLKFLKLNYALITNIFCDHLEYHKNFRNYIYSKFKIQKLLFDNSNLFLSKELYLKYQRYIKINKKRIFLNDGIATSKTDLNNYLKELNLNSIKKLVNLIDSKIKINNIKITDSLKFRNQLIYNSNNLKIYNDSKCTNLSNAIFKNNLLNSYRKILILGGKLKKQDTKRKYNIANSLVLIFGNQHKLFLNHLNFVNSNFFKFNNLNELGHFLKLILKNHKYDFVIFSPGAESFDSYKDFFERGNHFNRIIKRSLL